MVVTLGLQYNVGEKPTVILYTYIKCLKKKQNAPRPSEHPPVRGEKMAKRLGGIIDCKYKTSSWHWNGFPYMVVTLGQQYNIGEKLTVILHTYLNRHAGTPEKLQKQKHCSTLSNMVVIIYCCYIGCEDKGTTWYLNGFPDGSNYGSTV